MQILKQLSIKILSLIDSLKRCSTFVGSTMISSSQAPTYIRYICGKCTSLLGAKNFGFSKRKELMFWMNRLILTYSRLSGAHWYKLSVSRWSPSKFHVNLWPRSQPFSLHVSLTVMLIYLQGFYLTIHYLVVVLRLGWQSAFGMTL